MGNTSPASSYSKILFLNLSFLFFLFLLFLSHPLLLQQSPKPNITRRSMLQSSQEKPCDLRDIETSEAKCDFLLSSSQCSPQGYINYLRLFYCVCGNRRPLGLAVLLLWLILLFYLLGSTAATYFCSSLEGLSGVLCLSPAVAGTTLLSLGNGAPDVFSSIASFEGATASGVGLNSILGGALFVSTVVVGVVSVCVAPRGVAVDSLSFIRDACFLILVLVALTAILLAGKISVWVAMAFALLYLVYVFLVYITSVFGGILKNERGKQEEKLALHDPEEIKEELEAPLLGAVKLDKKPKQGLCSIRLVGRRIVHLLELPLYLPRRLTIPDICEDRWSKPFAVISAALSPILLATLWGSTKAVLCGGLFGLLMGCAAFSATEEERPPARFRLPWLAGGFLMSVMWTYVTAEELVSLLVSLGTILEISPALLGLTVLAWGDSLGDLIAAAAMAVSGGPGGAQVAISGCYAGPTFNTLAGLGIPMALSSWAAWPSPAAVAVDPGVFETLGFLAGAVLWALVILPKRGMKPDRVLGGGLFAIYLGFLSLRLSQSLAAQFVFIKSKRV